MSESTINIKEIIKSSNAVTTEDGQKVYSAMDIEFKKGNSVITDFEGIELIISTFLNASIGKLYGSYETPFIQQNLKIRNMSSDDLHVLKLVVDRAKTFFSSNPFPDAD